MRRALRRVLGSGTRKPRAEELEDLVQESLLRIVERLDSFRGESTFGTWAAAVATRVAFTELRRRSVRERGRAPFEEAVRDALDESTPQPEDRLDHDQLLGVLARAIDSALTDRQRIAILAELRGIPTIEIARQLNISTNTLYKLVHDARKKLSVALERSGFTPELVRDQLRNGALT